MFPASVLAPTYRCPGENYDISRPVHLARLAAGYDRCRDCPHRDEQSQYQTAKADPATTSPATRRSLFTAEGVRGIHLNELTRSGAAELAGAFASCLWDEFATADEFRTGIEPIDAGDDGLACPVASEGITVLASGRPGPLVVLAHDERPASPDLVMGIGAALRRMGCQVVDIGPVTRPCFWFAVHQLHAAGGIQATGSGCDPAWTGMDFVRQGVLPCSRGGDLDRIESRWREGYGRPSRRPGSQRLYSAAIAYEAGLWQHFHALRPLRIAMACPNRLLREMLGRIFRKLACRLIVVEAPTRARDLDDDRDPDAARVATAVRANKAHLGILIDDDAQRCVLFADDGARTSPERVVSLFAALARESHPAGFAVGETAAMVAPAKPGSTPAGRAGLATMAAMSQALGKPGALCGGGASGRYWFVEAFPNCDAVLTLVRLLQILSRSDKPFSEVLAEAA